MILGFNVKIDKIGEAERGLAKDWGWGAPSNEILELAGLSLELQRKKTGEILVYLGFCSEQKIKKYLSTKPFGTLALQWFKKQIPELRINTFVEQKILALHAGFPVLTTFDEILVHPEVKTTQEVHRACDRLDAVLMLQENIQPILLFSSYKQLKDYQQQGREIQLEDPIRKILKKNNIDEIKIGLADPQIIAQTMRRNASSENYMGTDDGVVNEDVWYSYQTKDSDILRRFARLMDEAAMDNITDISIEPNRDGSGNIRYRQFGRMTKPSSTSSINPSEAEELYRFLLARSRANATGSRLLSPADGQFLYRSDVGEVFVRASFIPIDRGRTDIETISVALRLLPRKQGSLITLNELHMEKKVVTEIENAVSYSQGLIIVAGPTNSGKSTTIAGMIAQHVELFGSTQKRLSIEDPVERFLPEVLQISIPQNKKDSFSEIMKATLRHDPDMIWIGEVREAEAAKTCIRAATSGHLVLTTFHANDSILAWKTFGNLVDRHMQVDLISSLSMIIGQRLLPRVCPHCGGSKKPTPKEMERFDFYTKTHGITNQNMPSEVAQVNKEGCDNCSNGISGIVPIHEILPVSRDVKIKLSESQWTYEDVAPYRTQTLFGSAMKLLNEGQIAMESIFI